MSRRQGVDHWTDLEVTPGIGREGRLVVSESYAGVDIAIPFSVWKGPKDGPAVFITAAVHGDEINGTGAIRHILMNWPFELAAGTLVMVPVVNLMGFERHSRYLPDRRDLNRSFPGSLDGSLAARLANAVFEGIVKPCQYGIDLHTAAVRRTNFPNVRADLHDEKVASFARAWGAELTMHGVGPEGSLRAAACQAGVPTIILEAGEVWKVEPTYVEHAVRGIRNCLIHLGMVQGEPEPPAYRIEADKSKWVRANNGGFLSFHVGPGDFVNQGDAIATNTDLLGVEKNVVEAPRSGIILGMTTIPSVSPGDPICHIGYASDGALQKAEAAQDKLADHHLHERTRGDLARNVHLSDAPEASD
ncbi:MAG: succinylglutamate desuccinylase/aspartoacylase family protein [Phycisphaerales bacterium JB060]